MAVGRRQPVSFDRQLTESMFGLLARLPPWWESEV